MHFILIDPNEIPDGDSGQMIDAFALFQNFPNPFNPRTEIRYQLPERSGIELVIYNTLGEKVKTLIHQEMKPAGAHSNWWDGVDESGSEAASGIYFATLQV